MLLSVVYALDEYCEWIFRRRPFRARFGGCHMNIYRMLTVPGMSERSISLLTWLSHAAMLDGVNSGTLWKQPLVV